MLRAAPFQTVPSMSIGPRLTFDHPEACFIESLLKLELFDTAIETCRARSRLAMNSQPEAAAQWSMLEMHVVAAKAAADPAIVDDPSRVNKLLAANQPILERNLDSPRVFWLRQHMHWCRWFVLRRLQAAYVAVPARASIRDWSLSAIRESLSELDALQTEIKSAPGRDPKSNTKSVTTAEQWSSLSNDIVLLQSDLLFLRTIYYPAKSTERIGAASEILSAIEKAELRIGTDWPNRPSLDLAKYTAMIHLDRPQDALDGIKALDKQLRTSAEGKPRQGNRWQTQIATLAAEACRNLGNIPESNRWLESVGGWTAAPELAIEHFANIVLTADGQSTSDSKLAEALKVKDDIGNRFGSYWQQRADAILLANNTPAANTASANNPPTNTPPKTSLPSAPSLKVELFKSEAKQLLAAKRPDDAIEKLNQAELAAASSGNEAAAIEMVIAAAAILDREGRKDEAEGEFHRAAMTYNKQPKAPDCAMMSVMGFSKAHAIDSGAKELSPAEEKLELKQRVYQGRLMDIVNTWPSSGQATQALSKLDRLLLATDQLPELASLWTKRLEKASSWQSSDENRRKQLLEYDQAISRFALIAIAMQDAWFDRTIYSSDLAKRTRVSHDELRTKLIEKAALDNGLVQKLLDSIRESSRWPNANGLSQSNRTMEKQSSVALEFLAPIATPTRTIEIKESLETLEGSKLDPTSSLALQWCSAELMFQNIVRAGGAKQIAKTEVDQLRVCVNKIAENVEQASMSLGRLQSLQLQRSMKLYRSAIGCWEGREATELENIKKAIASEPKAPWWKYRSARLYQSIPSQREQALGLYLQLATGFTAGSEPWLDVRARTAQTLRQMSEEKKAKELCDIVFATYPSAAQEWRSRFER